MGAPTATVSPSSASRRPITPADSDWNSTLALSVSMSASGCASAIVVPGVTSQLWITASVAPARTSGMRMIWAISASESCAHRFQRFDDVIGAGDAGLLKDQGNAR